MVPPRLPQADRDRAALYKASLKSSGTLKLNPSMAKSTRRTGEMSEMAGPFLGRSSTWYPLDAPASTVASVVDEAEQETILTPLWHGHAGTNDNGRYRSCWPRLGQEVLSSDEAPIVRGHDQACPLDTDNLTTSTPRHAPEAHRPGAAEQLLRVSVGGP